jgi:hypothetical protein
VPAGLYIHAPRLWRKMIHVFAITQVAITSCGGAEVDCNLRSVGRAEDEIRIDAEDALGVIEGLEVRRVFSGWGFYRRGLLFAAAWEGEFRFRTRQGHRWIYDVVDRELLGRPDELVSVARGILARLEAEPAASGTGKRGSGAARRRR